MKKRGQFTFARSMCGAKLTLAALLAATYFSPVRGAEETQDWIEFHFDQKPHAPHMIVPGLSAGFELTATVESEGNFDLDSADDEDETILDPELSLGILYDQDRWVRAYVEATLSHDVVLDSSDDEDPETTLELEEAYVTLFNETRNAAATFGRWNVSDEREWLFDQELDGAQLVWRNDRHAVELMYARKELVKKDLLGESESDNPDWFLARYFGRLASDTTVSLYALHGESNDDSGNSLTWLGGSLAGEIGESTEFWVESAGVFGIEDNRDVVGFGTDIGITHRFEEIALQPRLTAAIAFGSGDDGAGTDSAYRQTGLQGNGDRFGGKASFQYYGEVVDPELSNLTILTLGAGIDVTEKTSIDFVYHHFRQNVTTDLLRDSNLDEDPSGNSSHIGDEIDLIVGIRELDNLDIDLKGGVFIPGKAFEDDRDTAWYGEIKISSKF